jgi:prevent-host-death family protein
LKARILDGFQEERMDLRRVFDCMISVSELGRGQASKVIQAVEDEGSPYIVVKNNKPQAVIISINEYIELMKAKDVLTAMKAPREHDFYGNLTDQNNFSPNFPPHRSGSLTTDESISF